MNDDKDLSPLEHKFALEYVKDFNIARAAADCGLNSKNLYTSGYNLLKRVNVQNIIAIEIGKRDQISAVDALYVIERLVQVLEVDLVEWMLLGESGSTEDQIRKMPPEVRRLVSSIKKREVYNKDTNETTTTYEFKMMSKDKAIEMLGKHLGMFDKRIQIDAHVSHNYVEWAEKMRQKRNEKIINVKPTDNK